MTSKLETFNEGLFETPLESELNNNSTSKPAHKSLSEKLSSIKNRVSERLPLLKNRINESAVKYFRYMKGNSKGAIYSALISAPSEILLNGTFYGAAVAIHSSGDELLPIALTAYVPIRIFSGCLQEYMVRKQKKEGKMPLTGDWLSSLFGPIPKMLYDIGTKTAGLLSGDPGLIAVTSIQTYKNLFDNIPNFAKNLGIITGRELGLDRRLKESYKKLSHKLGEVCEMDKYPTSEYRNVTDHNLSLGLKETSMAIPYINLRLI
jgi:hypothetical protein